MSHTTPASTAVSVLIVDDSAVVRGMLRQIIDKENGLEVSATAINGAIGVEEYKRIQPDVVLMDIEMPELNGIQALEEILKFDSDAKIIMCSSLTQSGAAMTVKALKMGAVDCLAKPSSTSIDRSQDFEEQLILRLRAFEKNIPNTSTSTRPAIQTGAHGQTTSPTAHNTAAQSNTISLREFPSSLAVLQPQVIAIGSSTGGPSALPKVLSKLNKNIDIPPILLTQHMPAGFTKMLAESLTKDAGMQALEASDDMLLKSNTIYVAPGGKHLTVEKRTSGIFTLLTNTEPVNHCKPAVDVMMDSILETYKSGIISVILTGMGHDGLESCKKIIEAHHTNILIGQDEETSAVWGMPAAVAKEGICHAVLPIDNIADAINKLLTGQKP